MNLKIEITDVKIDTRRGISKRTQQPYAMHSQQAYLHQEGKPYPLPISINVDEVNGNPQPYAIGLYTLTQDSIYVDRYGSLAIKPVLVQIQQAVDSRPKPQVAKSA